MEFSALKMLYATHVIEGKRTIESVPEILREDVAKNCRRSKKASRNKIIGYVVSGAIGFLAGCFYFK